MNNLEKIKKKYEKYIGPNYVYKKCIDFLAKNLSMKWLVILEKIKGTKTNEGRFRVVNRAYAKFRADKLRVIKIINVNNPNLTKKYIVNIFNDIKIRYKVGKITYPNKYDENIDVICSSGIHYFNTIDPAYFYIENPVNHTGYVYEWKDNGEIRYEGLTLKGIMNGKWTFWHSHGIKSSEGEYLKGQKNGIWICWYENGKRKAKETYIMGNLNSITHF